MEEKNAIVIMKPIILIAYRFPPYAGVGCYRWSKLCKYLAELGHTIHVVTVDWQHLGPDTFIEDVQDPNIVIHKIPSGDFHPNSAQLHGSLSLRPSPWETPMRKRLSAPEILECYRSAVEARHLAEAASTPAEKADLLQVELQEDASYTNVKPLWDPLGE